MEKRSNISAKAQTPEEQARMRHIAKVIVESINMPRAKLEEAYRQLAFAEYNRLHPNQTPIEEPYKKAQAR
jgi:hypothetical protein